jgi:4-hydroxy-tetrahydrodipicolinate reductase
MTTRVLAVGLGPIGAAVARQVATRPGFKLAGALDLDPAKAGRDVGELIGLGRPLRVKVQADLAAAVRGARPDVALLCTSSSLARVAPLLESVLRLHIPVVSTTEELAYPWRGRKGLARRIDAAARKAKVAVLGTGVNPGFAMDALPITLTAVCETVTSIRVDRIQDARIRRLPFQQKIGAGLTPMEFAQKVDAGTVRHVGLAESVAMIADSFGWRVDRITDDIAPKVAEVEVESEFLKVDAGRVAGLVQDGIGYRDGRPAIVLHMEAYLGAPETYDAVTVEGNPPLRFKAEGGIHGDVATASIVVNSIPRVRAAPPGLHTMRTLPLPSWTDGSGRGSRL